MGSVRISAQRYLFLQGIVPVVVVRGGLLGPVSRRREIRILIR